MIRAILLFIGVATIFGCATPKSNYRAPEIEISDPPLGSINVARVGEDLLRQATYAEHDAIKLEAEMQVEGYGIYRFTPGHYIKQGEELNMEYYKPTELEGSGKVIKSSLSDPFKAIVVYTDKPTFCGVSILNKTVCSEDIGYVRFKVPVLVPDSYQQTLIYSGQAGDIIKIGYREFFGKSVLPDNSNDAEYDLSDSKVIGYKGAQVEVLEATNQYIRYKVLSNFNQAAF